MMTVLHGLIGCCVVLRLRRGVCFGGLAGANALSNHVEKEADGQVR